MSRVERRGGCRLEARLGQGRGEIGDPDRRVKFGLRSAGAELHGAISRPLPSGKVST